MHKYFSLLSPLVLLMAGCASISDDGSRVVTVDHYARVKSTAPAMAGQYAQIYVREVTLEGTMSRSSPAADRVVLFVHGAGTPAEVSFDVPYKDYSWMGLLGQSGFRCLLDGHDRLRPLDAPTSHERPVQFFEGAASAVCAETDSGAVRAVLSVSIINIRASASV